MGDVESLKFKYSVGDKFKLEAIIEDVDYVEELVTLSIPAFDGIDWEAVDLDFEEFLERFDIESIKRRLLGQKERLEKQLLDLESLEE